MKRSLTISLYWKCQLIGWCVAALYWQYAGFSPQGFRWELGLVQFSTDVFIYILITHLYRNFALSRGWQKLGLNKLLPRLVPAVLVLGLVYLLITSVKIYYIRLWLQPDISRPFGEFFDFYRDGILVAGIRLMSIWLLAYHLYHYSQREISIVKENARLAVITRDAQLNNLSAQLNPHFLFNSLNNIKALISDDPTSARRAIDLLSELLRSSLYHGDKQLITLKEELGLVRDYLELEKLRFEERLQYNICDTDLLQHILLPRLSIQTLTENAVKHGISKQKNGGLIAINILKDNGYLNITVSNPGKLAPAGESHGLGLKNLNERLQLHYQNEATFNINETAGTVSATIKIPLP